MSKGELPAKLDQLSEILSQLCGVLFPLVAGPCQLGGENSITCLQPQVGRVHPKYV